MAQLLAFQQRTGSGGGDVEGSSRTSSEGSASSLSGRKRRSVEEVTPRSRHLRFDSSDDEGVTGSGGASRRRPGSRSRAAATTAALQAVSIEDAVAAAEPGADPYPSVEDATEPVVAAAAAGDAAAAPRLPTLVVSNIHVLFNPKRGDLKLGQVRLSALLRRPVLLRIWAAGMPCFTARIPHSCCCCCWFDAALPTLHSPLHAGAHADGACGQPVPAAAEADWAACRRSHLWRLQERGRWAGRRGRGGRLGGPGR